MADPSSDLPELVSLVSIIAEKFHGTPLAHFLYVWENMIYSVIIGLILVLLTFLGTRRMTLVPRSRLQTLLELVVSGIDSFVCGILGPKGRKYTPFIGTLFVYIICMNLFGLIPFMKSSTASWSTTMALALCVFVYLQYTAFKELGFFGYIYHLMGQPKGFLAFTVVIPLLMFFLHLLGEFIKPITLSLRLRSNIWADDLLLAVLAGFGLKGIPLYLFNTFITIISSIVQAVVFTLLTTIYFAIVLEKNEDDQTEEPKEVTNGL